MPTIEHLIAEIEREIREHEATRRSAIAEIEAIVDHAQSVGHGYLGKAADDRAEILFERGSSAKAAMEHAQRKLARAKAVKAEEDRAELRLNTIHESEAGVEHRSAGEVYEMSVAPTIGSDGTIDYGKRPAGEGSLLYGAPVSSASLWRTHDGRPAALEPGQRFSDHETVREINNRNGERDRLIVGTAGSLPMLLRNLSTSASAVIPSQWPDRIFDLLRNESAIMRANPTIVPMRNKTEYLARLSADVTNVAFRAEGDTITEGDPTFEQITLTAHTISGLCVMCNEFADDSGNGGLIVQQSLAQVLALKVDQAALYGGMVTGDNDEGFNLPDPPTPKGLPKMLSTDLSANVLGYAANGMAITAATPWNEILDTIDQVKRSNSQPTALIWNTRMAQKLAKTYDSTYQQLALPREMSALRVIESNQIPSFTRGSMTGTATDVVVGNFSDFLVGQRVGLEVERLDQRYAEVGSIAFVVRMRICFALAHPQSFAIYRALGGA